MFFFWFFGRKTCGTLATQPGIESAPPALEGEVLITEPPEKSPHFCFFKKTENKINIFIYLWFQEPWGRTDSRLLMEAPRGVGPKGYG